MNQTPTNWASSIIKEVHQLNITNELLELAKTHPDSFFKYYSWVYKTLDNILLGQRLVVGDVIKPKNRKLFIFIVCQYIEESYAYKEDSYLEFSDDYHFVIRKKKIVKPKKKSDKWKLKKWIK